MPRRKEGIQWWVSWCWMPMLLLVLGVISFSLLVWTNHLNTRIFFKDDPYDDAIMSIQILVANSHLWLEEHIAEKGGEIDPEKQIKAPLNLALNRANSLLEGGHPDEHNREIQPLEDPELRKKTKALVVLLENLKDITLERLQHVSTSGTGSELDEKIDEIYRRISSRSAEIEQDIEALIAHDISRVRSLFGFILFIWAAVIALAFGGLWKREKQRMEAKLDALWALKKLKEINRLQESLLGPGTFEEKLKKITDSVVGFFGADFCRIWITEAGDLCDGGCPHAETTEELHVCRSRDRCLHLKASSGRYTHIDGRIHRRVPFGCYKIGRVAAGDRVRFLTNDVTRDPSVHNHDWARDLGLVSFAGYRLISTNARPLGVLALFSKKEISPGEDAMLEGVADATAYLIQQAKTENELAMEKERLFITLSSIGDGVISTDVVGKVVLVNQEAEKLTGWTLKEAAGRPLAEVFKIINEKTGEPCENPVEKVLETGGVVGLANHTALIARDGSHRIIADSGAPVKDNNGEIIGVVLVFRDITHQRRMEEELRKTHQRETIGLLAGGIAHDFNNILTAVLGNISLARIYTKKDLEVSELLATAEKASLKAKHLTHQLLSFARGESPFYRTVSLTESIEDTVAFVLRGSNVSCKKTIPDNLWAVEVEEGQLSQLVQNMIINACQAMPEGGKMEIACENLVLGADDEAALELGAGKYVKFSVKDQGSGISDEHLKKVFDPYFSTKNRGSGLGLSIVHSIVRNHEGKMTVESEIGKGTAFSIYLPASENKADTDKGVEIIVPGQGRVLVMDDEESVREIVKEMLETVGYQVTTASNGNDAVALYRKALAGKEPFDKVILDLTVPGSMGGKETMKRLRELDAEVVGIAFSGYTNDPVITDFREYGFSGVITKPFKIQRLSKVLSEV